MYWVPPDEWVKRWPNFEPREVLSRSGLFFYEQKRVMLIRPYALDFLQGFRFELDQPFIINHGEHESRGYRNALENKAAGGKLHSLHMQGVAFDITVPDLRPSEIASKAQEYGWMGVGVGETFTHLDVGDRERQTLWRY